MKKFIFFTLILFHPLTTIFAAVPDATYFVGLSNGSKSYKLEVKEAKEKTTYSSSQTIFQAGVRGKNTHIYFEFSPEKKFESEDFITDMKSSSTALNVGFFNSLDLLYLALNGKIENMKTEFDGKDVLESPSGTIYGAGIAAGGFLGHILSIEFGYSYMLTELSNDDYTISNVATNLFTIAYHIKY